MPDRYLFLNRYRHGWRPDNTCRISDMVQVPDIPCRISTVDRTEYFFILGGLADNLAGYLTGKHDFPCWISSRVLDIPCRISGWIPDITLWISELVITFHITGRVPELFCRIRYLSWYQIFFVQNLAGRVHGIPCWISGQVLACRVLDILGWIGICPGTGYSLPDVRSGHGYSLPGIWPDNKYCYRWIKRRNPVASIQQNPNPVHPVTVWLKDKDKRSEQLSRYLDARVISKFPFNPIRAGT